MTNIFFLAARKARLYRRVFSSPDGKAVLSDLAKYSQFVKETATPLTPFEDGKRQAFLYILRNINANPDELLKKAKDFDRERNAYFP